MTKDNPVTIILQYKKETRRFHAYELVNPDDEIPRMYANIHISKAELKGQSVPEKLQIVIKPV